MFSDPRTATPDCSIWLHLPENTFRQHLVKLEERTNAVPIDPKTFDIQTWQPFLKNMSSISHTLPIQTEQQLADDFARLVAVEEGAQSVAAVSIEEWNHPPRLTLRFAAFDMFFGAGLHTALQRISDILLRVAVEPEEAQVGLVADIFHHIVQLHFVRLLGRLRSSRWEKPKYLAKSHKKPLWQDFSNLLHRTEFLYTKREKALKQQVVAVIASLASVYQAFENVTRVDEFPALMRLVDQSFEFINIQHIKDLVSRLERSAGNIPTPQVGSAIKCLRQVQKIAGYRRMSLHFVDTARRYPQLFQHGLTLDFLTPYQSVPTTLGYESWATSCHVHAEIQLAVHYDLCLEESIDEFLQPRCIGISKWLCFLCYRFLEAHGRFFPSKTHGRLYDQWTIPDLVEFGSEAIERYRTILKMIDDGLLNQIQKEPELYRIEPMTSID